MRITDTLPAGTTFVSEWNPGGWTVDTSHPGLVMWQADYLPGWTGRRLELRLRTNSGLARGTTLHNRVEISGDAPDAESGNNTWEHDANVQDPYGNVSVGTGYGHGIPVAGYEYTTWVQVSSQGNVPATGAVLTDTLPTGATFVRAVQREWNPATDDYDIETAFPPAAQGTGWVRWNLPDVPAWREFRMEVTFRIGASTAIGAELVNQVDVALPGDQDPATTRPSSVSARRPPAPTCASPSGMTMAMWRRAARCSISSASRTTARSRSTVWSSKTFCRTIPR